jgi:hypothetical protein
MGRFLSNVQFISQNCFFRAIPGEQQGCINPEGRMKMSVEDARKRREAPLDTPRNLGSNATTVISAALATASLVVSGIDEAERRT